MLTCFLHMVDVNEEYVKHRRYFLEENSGKENDRRMALYKKVNKDIREDEERLKEHEKK